MQRRNGHDLKGVPAVPEGNSGKKRHDPDVDRTLSAIDSGSIGRDTTGISGLPNALPADLTGEKVRNLSDGAIFLVISNGVPERMPALNENLTVRDRWDIVNFLRTLPQE